MSTESNNIFSSIAIHNKYARFLRSEGRRESWDEICERNKQMHIDHFPTLADDINNAYESYVKPKLVLPSMRSLQFGGLPIERNNSRIYNCSFLPAGHTDFFSELIFLLLGGTGVGYSVLPYFTSQLGVVRGCLSEERRYIVGDSIEGWADAVKVLIEAYYFSKPRPRMDYQDVREKGTELITSGGKAPGPEPLREALVKIEGVLHEATGRMLRPIEVHDIACHLADAVLAGGIRRAAMIALFHPDDIEMMTCKSGNWWELNPQRGRANNSVLLDRSTTTYDEFIAIWERVKESGSGEPGILWTNDLTWGTNPCGEIALQPYQFCNLTEVNASNVSDTGDLVWRAHCAAFLGTLQAAYTDFHYLRGVWKRTTEEEALIGVGMTGIGSGKVLGLDLREAANAVKYSNNVYSRRLGINLAARTTTVKPSGTSSIVLGCSSGVHAWHDPYYIRRMRLNKNEPLYQYLSSNLPELVEDDFHSPYNTAVISLPQKAPEGAIYRDEGAMSLFNRALKMNTEWVHEGHNGGVNRNNCSTTISVKDNEWDELGQAMWLRRHAYNGMTVLPYDGGTYKQAPFESCSEDVYREMEGYLHAIDLREVHEGEDFTQHTQEAACAGGVCEI